MQLDKLVVDNDALHVEYSKLVLEWDKAEHRTKKVKQVM
jgi:hypothetical protein